MNVRDKHLKRAARAAPEVAALALGTAGGHPRLAAYLLHVGIECALKWRILRGVSKKSIEEARKPLGDELWDSVFKGTRGHRLEWLARTANLSRCLVAAGAGDLLLTETWQRMQHSERPYSLRYGYEEITRQQALEEQECCEKLIRILIDN